MPSPPPANGNHYDAIHPPSSSSSHKIRLIRPSAQSATPTPAASTSSSSSSNGQVKGTPSLKIKLSKRPRTEDHDSSSSSPLRRPTPTNHGQDNWKQPSLPASTSSDRSAASPVYSQSSPWGTASNSPYPQPPPAKRRKRVPIKDALTKLIQQLIKRDAYAIFTQPVDEREVPGYHSIIQHPMDFGTMQTKIRNDAYGRLDQFKFDFLLVTGNAKVFNMPDSFYHQQAQKTEDWGLKAIETVEAKGVREQGDAPSPEPENAGRSPLTPVQMARLSHLGNESSPQSPVESPGSANGSVKRLSIKIKRPSSSANGSSSPVSASDDHFKAKKKERSTDKPSKKKSKIKSIARPLISSSLSRPPMLADSPSPASSENEDHGGTSSSDESDDDDDEERDEQQGEEQEGDEREISSESASSDEDSEDDQMQERKALEGRAGHASHTGVKVEEDSDEEMADLDEDEDGGFDDSRADSMSVGLEGLRRDSETPIPGTGYSRRKQPPLSVKPKFQQKRNAPMKAEESVSVAIQKILEEAQKNKIPMSVYDAALEMRHSRQYQSTKVPTFALDGSFDLEQCRPSERHGILSALGYHTDETTGAPITENGLPEISSAYPLHPDAQKHLERLARLVPSDSLSIATNTDARPKETTGSHYEHALPAGHRRMPTTVPTASASAARPQGPDGTFIPGDGVVASQPSTLPSSWPHPSRATGKDYEPPTLLDPLYPNGTEDPAANRPKYRNKDFEREAEGQANLRDWTYPHVYYSRAWDGSGDLALWKDLDGTLRSAGFGLSEPYQRWEESRALRMREMINAEEKQAVHLCSEKAVRADAKERARKLQELMASDANVKTLPDDESELGLLNKLLQLDEEMVAGDNALQGNQRKSHATLLPAERMRHTINGAEFLTRELWGQPTIPGIRPGHPGLTPIPVPGGIADGEMWARSIESFIEGAIGDGDTDSDEEDADDAGAQETVCPADSAAGQVEQMPDQKPVIVDTSSSSPDLESPSPPPRGAAELLLDAHVQGMILDRPLYEFVRDDIVAPQTHFRNLTTTALLGESLREFDARTEEKKAIKAERAELEESISVLDDEIMGQVKTALEDASPMPPHLPWHSAAFGITAESAAWVLLYLPLIWSSTSYLKRLLESPMHIDTEHLMLKREDWMQPELPEEYNSESGKSHRWPVRMEEKEWTGPRITAALEQYGEALVRLDKKIRNRQGSDEDTAKLKNFTRLALLAIARLAPGWAIKVSRR
ncbi:unnamed protein product [Sympodiomycopsis kandeliae]